MLIWHRVLLLLRLTSIQTWGCFSISRWTWCASVTKTSVSLPLMTILTLNILLTISVKCNTIRVSTSSCLHLFTYYTVINCIKLVTGFFNPMQTWSPLIIFAYDALLYSLAKNLKSFILKEEDRRACCQSLRRLWSDLVIAIVESSAPHLEYKCIICKDYWRSPSFHGGWMDVGLSSSNTQRHIHQVCHTNQNFFNWCTAWITCFYWLGLYFSSAFINEGIARPLKR